MRKLLTFAGLVAAVAVLSIRVGAQDAKPTDKGDKADTKLEGGYTIVSGESDGKALPEEKVKGHTTRFTKDKIVTVDKDKKEVYVATYKLDESKKPCVITMKTVSPAKEAEAKGLIKKEGDTITLIYALPGGEMPTEFKTKEKQNLFVLKNLKKGDEKAKSKTDE